MLGIALLILLLVLGLRAFLALRRETVVRREFGQNATLDWVVLLYPLGPLTLLLGPRWLPQTLCFVVVAAFYICALVLSSRQRTALECSGTDRVKGALEATSSASLGAIVGIIYVCLSGIFVLVALGIRSPALGA